LRINTNVTAINAWRQSRSNSEFLDKSLERLSSGLRVNRAADDAAGLAVAESMRAQVRGTQQAMRNVQDGIAMLNVADGGLSEIHDLLQRGRALSVQAANDTLGADARDAIQAELDQLSAEIDRLSQTTTYNGVNLLQGSKYSDADRQLVLDALQNGALKDAYDKVIAGFGLTHATAGSLPVKFVDSDSFAAAYVTFSGPIFAPATLSLTVVLDWAVPLLQSGGQQAFEYVMAHEMVHAVMADETNMFAFPGWFMEGAAEFLIGADGRVSSSLASMGGDTPANRAALVGLLADNNTAMSSSNHYSAAYLAVKYLDDKLRDAGHAGGIVAAFNNLDDSTNTLNDIVTMAGMGYTDQDDFLAQFKADFATWSYLPGNVAPANLNLAGADTGSITGSDYGGAPLDVAAVVPTTGSTADPTPWNEIWPDPPTTTVVIQTGANQGQELTLSLTNVSAGSLGVNGLDVSSHADAADAIASFNAAISLVSSTRGALGAQANQMEHTVANLGTANVAMAAAESRIRDADMADELTTFTRRQVLAESSRAALSHATLKPATVLSLLGA
jgi:flagellin